jgi:fructokinase
MTPLAARSFDVVALGEALIDLLPSRPGPLSQVASFERHPGGAPANVAIGVARLEGKVAFAGAVGDDPFGEYLIEALRAEGVDTRACRPYPRGRTGMAFVSLDGAGSPTFFSAGGGGAELLLDEAGAALAPIEDARFFQLGTYILSGEASRAAAFSALTRARAAGTLVALDPNLRVHLWRDPAALTKAVQALVPLVDIVKLSSEECAIVCGVADPARAARELVDRGVRLAVVTCGAAGCVWARRRTFGLASGAVPTRPVRVVDATGAGDAFLSALLVGLARRYRAGEDALALDNARVERLLAIANEAGTRVCERIGAVAGLPRASDLPSLDV